MSACLHEPELNYPTMEKQAYTIYKAVKQFKPYLLKNDCIVFVPHPTVRLLLVQQELGEIRANWMTRLQEYDIGIKPVHTIKGHGICRLAEELVGWEQEIDMYNVEWAPPHFTW